MRRMEVKLSLVQEGSQNGVRIQNGAGSSSGRFSYLYLSSRSCWDRKQAQEKSHQYWYYTSDTRTKKCVRMVEPTYQAKASGQSILL
jgi:hypothetical protein